VTAPASVVGHLDLPAPGATVLPGLVAFSGWAAHRRRRLSAVVLRVDGSFAAIAPVTGPRPDVGSAHPLLVAADTSGWSAEVDLEPHAGAVVTVEAYGLVEPEPDAAGRVIPFGSVTLQVSSREGADRAVFVTGSVRPGAVTVHGLAEARDGIGRIDVSCDGSPVGPARILLPGRFEDGGSDHPLSGLARFECDVDVPGDRESIELTARVVTGGGQAFGARPSSVPVRPDDPSPSRADRLERLAALNDALARAARSAETATAPGSPRVLVLAHDLGLGGGQLYLHDLLLGLAARGVAFAVTSLRGGILLPVLEDLGIPVAVTGAFDPTDPEQYEAHVRQVMVFGAAHGCEVALANALPTFGAVDAAQRLGLQVVWALHESFPLDHFWNHAYGVPVAPHVRDRARHALARTHRAVFEATATAEMYAPLLPEGAGAVVPYGVPMDEIDDYRASHDRAQLRASLGFAEDTLVLVCVAMIEARKAQANLAAAFAGSSRLRDRDVALVLVGAQPHSPYVAELAGAVSKWGEHRIRIEPVQPDTYRWYHAADVLVSGSDIESLPRSMLEAMAFGRPVASTAVFGVPELVTEGETGFLCRSRDVLAMREMMERVADTPRDDLAAMGLRAAETVRRRHDPAIYVEHYHRALVQASR
jgi:D-inositol-3-phosphate glycosyltransferase